MLLFSWPCQKPWWYTCHSSCHIPEHRMLSNICPVVTGVCDCVGTSITSVFDVLHGCWKDQLQNFHGSLSLLTQMGHRLLVSPPTVFKTKNHLSCTLQPWRHKQNCEYPYVVRVWKQTQHQQLSISKSWIGNIYSWRLCCFEAIFWGGGV
jgi:hypothetical protein